MNKLWNGVSHIALRAPDGGGSGGGATGGDNPPPPAASWFQGKITDNDVIGHMQNRGWHTKTAEEVAIAAVTAHRHAELQRGYPAEEVLRLPKDRNAADMGKIYSALGKPESADKYNLADVKFTNGTALSEDLTGFIRSTAFANNLSQEGAADVAKSLVKFLEDADTKEASAKTANLAQQRIELAKNWGVKPDEAAIRASPHMQLVKRAVDALGWDAEIVNALEQQVGYAKVLSALGTLGQRLGEDKYISGVGNNGLMTRDQAIARRNELSKDSAWVKKYLAGDAEAGREMLQINTIIAGVGA